MEKLKASIAIALMLFYCQLGAAQYVPVNFNKGLVAAAGIGPLDFHVGGAGWTAGSALTPTLLNSGTLGNANHGGWVVNGTGITTASAVTGCDTSGAIQIDGTFTASGYTQKAIAVDNTGNSRNATATIPNQGTGGFFAISQEFCVNIGAANDGAGSSLFDLNRVIGITGGDQYVIQLQNGTAGSCGAFAFEIEYVNSGGTQHTPCVAASPSTTYKISWTLDVTSTTADTGVVTAKIYNTSNVQLGSTISITNGPTNQQLLSTCLGNCSAHGISTGSNTFQNWSVRYSAKPPFLDPVNTTQDPIYWVASTQGANHSVTNTTTLVTSKALETHVGDIVVDTCANENASGATTSVSSTAGETFTGPASTKSAANNQSISQWYTFVLAGNTAQTYTCTWPASNFSNNMAVLLHGGSAFDTGGQNNTGTGSNITSSPYTPSSATATSVACGYHQSTGTINADNTNNYFLFGDSTNSRGCSMRTNTPTSSQTTTLNYVTSSVGMISVGVYK